MEEVLPKALKPVHRNSDQTGRLIPYANTIEKYLDANGINSKVVLVNTEQNGLQFCLKIALGTTVESVLKLSKGLAAVLAAPRDKVIIEAPIPWTDLIGITIPWVYPYPDLPSEAEPPESVRNNAHAQEQKETDTTDAKTNLRKYAYIIEETYKSFEWPVAVTEIDVQEDKIVFYCQPKKEMEAKDIVKYYKDIALGLAVPPNLIGIKAPMGNPNLFGVLIPRYTNKGRSIWDIGKKPDYSISGMLFPFVRDTCLNIGRYFFPNIKKSNQSNDLKLSPRQKQLKRIQEQRKSFRKMDARELVRLFNEHVGRNSFEEEELLFITAIQMVFDDRSIDYSAIAGIKDGLLLHNEIKLEGKILKIISDQQ